MNRSARHLGFSLLEVLLAMAILGGAIVVLGEAGRFGLENARMARDLSEAQLLCETKLAEIATSGQYPEMVNGDVLSGPSGLGRAGWLYAVETEDVDNGLLAVRVTVMQDLPEENRPVSFSVVRWMVDPNVAQEQEEEQQANQEQSKTSTGGTTTQPSGTSKP